MRSLLLALALTTGLSGPALACSPVSGYRTPTNVEVVQEADLVVLARVEGERQVGPDRFDRVVVLKPIRALKGALPSELIVGGTIWERTGPMGSNKPDRPFAPMPTPLNRPHPTTLWGACLRQGYAQDALVLGAFKKDGEGYLQLGYAFARVVEDVEGLDGLWVRAAETYVRNQASGGGRKGLAAERDRLRRLGTADGRAIADDIQVYLDAPARSRR